MLSLYLCLILTHVSPCGKQVGGHATLLIIGRLLCHLKFGLQLILRALVS